MSFRRGPSRLLAGIAGGIAKSTGLNVWLVRVEDHEHEDDEVLVILNSGKVARSDASEVPAKGRDTMGVVFARMDKKDSVVGVARNSERDLGEVEVDEDAEAVQGPAPDASESAETGSAMPPSEDATDVTSAEDSDQNDDAVDAEE